MSEKLLEHIVTYLGLFFTVTGSIAGIYVVYTSYKATILKINSDERIEHLKIKVSLLDRQLHVYERLCRLHALLCNNINNLGMEIKEDRIEGLKNTLSNERWRLEYLISIYFSKETFRAYKRVKPCLDKAIKRQALKEDPYKGIDRTFRKVIYLAQRDLERSMPK